MIETADISTLIPAADRLGQVEEYYFSRKLREIAEMRAARYDVLNLGIGSPDLPPHPSVIEALQTAAAQAGNHAYQSYQGLPELRKAFADWYDRYFQVALNPMKEVLPLMGSKEGIMHISMAFLNPGDEVLVPNPGYPTYSSAAKLTGARIRHYDLAEAGNWYPDLTALAATDLSRVKIMWVNYPHMPTGTPPDPAFFVELIAFAQAHEILVVNDNPYAFLGTDSPQSLLSVPGAKSVALELNSLSKAHNMAGWRIGMVAGNASYIQTILRFKSNMDSGMFKPLQLAAIEALNLPSSWYAQQNSTYAKRRQVAEELLTELGCEIGPGQLGMFVWAKVPSSYRNSYELADELLANNHVFLTPGGIFGKAGEAYIRISLCSSVDTIREAQQRLRG